jgi:hypothetical protein
VTIVATLTQTIREDTCSGVRVSIVSPTAGEVDANWFSFQDHDVFGETRSPREARSGELDRLNQRDLLQVDRIRAWQLRAGVETYTAAFAPAAPPEFLAASRLGALVGPAGRLDHLGSIYPRLLNGRALGHAHVLREVAAEIYHDLLPLVGLSQTADSAPLSLLNGLSELRRLQTSLVDLAASAEDADLPDHAAIFSDHAQVLAGIDEQISADHQRDLARISADRGPAADARAPERVSAARSSSPVAAAPVGPSAAVSVASPLPLERGTGKGRS